MCKGRLKHKWGNWVPITVIFTSHREGRVERDVQERTCQRCNYQEVKELYYG